ncbi:MAG TPA: hypothetical protein VLC73_11190 [Burkholderiales bacterium]|nr:hypothetical protein [Burkholderiales bacterium]
MAWWFCEYAHEQAQVERDAYEAAENAARAAYKIPKLVRFAAEHEPPLTTTGKLQKNRLGRVVFPERTKT